MRRFFTSLLLVLLVGQAVLAVPASQQLHEGQKKDPTLPLRKIGSKSQANGKQILNMGKNQNKMVGENDFKFASGSLKNGEKMKHLTSKHKVDSVPDHPMMHQTSKHLNLQSDKATDEKLMKMLNSEKNPKLEFPKSGNTMILSHEHKDSWEGQNALKNHKRRRSNLAMKHSRLLDREKIDSVRPRKGRFNVFKVNNVNDRQTYRDVYEDDHGRTYLPRRKTSNFKEELDHEDIRKLSRSRKHHRPERRYIRDKRERRVPRKSYDDYEKNQDRPQHSNRKTEEGEYLPGMNKENLMRMGQHHAPKEFMGNQEMFRKSYGSMNFGGHGHKDMSPKFYEGLNDRQFMGMEKSGFGYSKGIFGGDSSEDFSPEY